MEGIHMVHSPNKEKLASLYARLVKGTSLNLSPSFLDALRRVFPVDFYTKKTLSPDKYKSLNPYTKDCVPFFNDTFRLMLLYAGLESDLKPLEHSEFFHVRMLGAIYEHLEATLPKGVELPSGYAKIRRELRTYGSSQDPTQKKRSLAELRTLAEQYRAKDCGDAEARALGILRLANCRTILATLPIEVSDLDPRHIDDIITKIRQLQLNQYSMDDFSDQERSSLCQFFRTIFDNLAAQALPSALPTAANLHRYRREKSILDNYAKLPSWCTTDLSHETVRDQFSERLLGFASTIQECCSSLPADLDSFDIYTEHTKVLLILLEQFKETIDAKAKTHLTQRLLTHYQALSNCADRYLRSDAARHNESTMQQHYAGICKLNRTLSGITGHFQLLDDDIKQQLTESQSQLHEKVSALIRENLSNTETILSQETRVSARESFPKIEILYKAASRLAINYQGDSLTQPSSEYLQQYQKAVTDLTTFCDSASKEKLDALYAALSKLLTKTREIGEIHKKLPNKATSNLFAELTAYLRERMTAIEMKKTRTVPSTITPPTTPGPEKRRASRSPTFLFSGLTHFSRRPRRGSTEKPSPMRQPLLAQ
jgi:hypothetical protein